MPIRKDSNQTAGLSIAEAAVELGLSERYVRKMIYDRKVTHERHGTRIVIPRDALEAYRHSVRVAAVDVKGLARGILER